MSSRARDRNGEVMLLVGTRKGAFIVRGSRSRDEWSLDGPHMAIGDDVFHMVYDPRGEGAIYAAANSFVFGPEVRRSDDLVAPELPSEEDPRFEGSSGATVKRVWHVEPGGEAEQGVVYAGVEPAALFRSDDGGSTWREIEGLTGHPSREKWQPGLGGLCLHSVVLDPDLSGRMWVGISAVGVLGTDDAGESWRTMNKNVRADFLPDRFPEFGQCTHKLLSHPARPRVLYQQNHCGVFRSDSGGEEWLDVTGELPSRFGFVLGLHSTDPETVYVLPEDRASDDNVGGGMRYAADAKLRVFRSRNGGGDWEPLTKGLPQENAYLHVMREGMATDGLEPCGVYVGTASGHIFYSRDDGDSWELMMEHLPPINSVECAVLD